MRNIYEFIMICIVTAIFVSGCMLTSTDKNKPDNKSNPSNTISNEIDSNYFNNDNNNPDFLNSGAGFFLMDSNYKRVSFEYMKLNPGDILTLRTMRDGNDKLLYSINVLVDGIYQDDVELYKNDGTEYVNGTEYLNPNEEKYINIKINSIKAADVSEHVLSVEMLAYNFEEDDFSNNVITTDHLIESHIVDLTDYSIYDDKIDESVEFVNKKTDLDVGRHLTILNNNLSILGNDDFAINDYSLSSDNELYIYYSGSEGVKYLTVFVDGKVYPINGTPRVMFYDDGQKVAKIKLSGDFSGKRICCNVYSADYTASTTDNVVDYDGVDTYLFKVD